MLGVRLSFVSHDRIFKNKLIPVRHNSLVVRNIRGRHPVVDFQLNRTRHVRSVRRFRTLWLFYAKRPVWKRDGLENLNNGWMVCADLLPSRRLVHRRNDCVREDLWPVAINVRSRPTPRSAGLHPLHRKHYKNQKKKKSIKNQLKIKNQKSKIKNQKSKIKNRAIGCYFINENAVSWGDCR